VKRLAWVVVAFLVVGCAIRTQTPQRGAETPPPQPPATVCNEGSDRLVLAGVKLLDPAEPVLKNLGMPDNVRHSAQYPMQTYEYGFGRPSVHAVVTVWGDGRVFSLQLSAAPVAHPLSELWPGVRFGDTRGTVLQALARQGVCPTTASDTTVEVVRSEQRLTLTFDGDGALMSAFLVLEKPPADSPSSAGGFYPPDVSTGTPEIDKVIRAAATKDGDTLAGLVKLSREACTTQVYGMPGQPICPDGTPDGTVLDVFPAGA
jgi:hypothetical protein